MYIVHRPCDAIWHRFCEILQLALCITWRGGLKLLSRPKTRITLFRALDDKEALLENDSK